MTHCILFEVISVWQDFGGWNGKEKTTGIGVNVMQICY